MIAIRPVALLAVALAAVAGVAAKCGPTTEPGVQPAAVGVDVGGRDTPGRLLDQLAVAPRGSGEGYTAAKFPHWSRQPGAGRGCDTRKVVLRRDGRDVTVDGQCRPTSGTWVSPYDGATWTGASDVDVDHVVPRKHAWETGAASWTQDQREAFANDLVRPELVTVTDNVNQAKGDKAPDQWKPPSVADWCRYASDWITVKAHYRLTVTTGEKAALTLMLDHC